MANRAILKEKIGFIGCGNMGGAILNGLLTKKVVKPEQIFVFDSDLTKTKELKNRSINVCRSNLEVADSAQIVILAIKPQQIYDLAKELNGRLRHDHIVISILAGTRIYKIGQLLRKKGSGVRFLVVRAMPNLPAQVGEAITVITSQSRVALKKAEAVFGACGKTLILGDEKYFNLVTAVSGSGPAYFFLLMESLVEFAKIAGLSEEKAKKLVVQTAIGAAKLACASTEAPAELRKRVTSKGGTTQAAISHLINHGVYKKFQQAWKRALQRAEELSGD